MNLVIPVHPGILFLIFLISLSVFISVTWVLFHHWNYYGVKNNRRVIAKSIYFIGGLVLLGFMFLFNVTYLI